MGAAALVSCMSCRVEHHEYVELRMPGNQLKGTLSCYLLLYSDSFMHQVFVVSGACPCARSTVVCPQLCPSLMPIPDVSRGHQ